MKETISHNTTEKQKYEKPRLEEIELFADEVLVTGCKMIGDSAPIATCDTGTCFNIGS